MFNYYCKRITSKTENKNYKTSTWDQNIQQVQKSYPNELKWKLLAKTDSYSLWESLPFQQKLHSALHYPAVQNLLHHILLLLFLLSCCCCCFSHGRSCCRCCGCCCWSCRCCRCWCGCCRCGRLLLLLGLLAFLGCYGRQLDVCWGSLCWTKKESAEMVMKWLQQLKLLSACPELWRRKVGMQMSRWEPPNFLQFVPPQPRVKTLQNVQKESMWKDSRRSSGEFTARWWVCWCL